MLQDDRKHMYTSMAKIIFDERRRTGKINALIEKALQKKGSE